jgi:hypothetical protein
MYRSAAINTRKKSSAYILSLLPTFERKLSIFERHDQCLLSKQTAEL